MKWDFDAKIWIPQSCCMWLCWWCSLRWSDLWRWWCWWWCWAGLGRRGFYYLSAASHLISDAAAVAAGGARARGEAAAAAKAASDLPPHSPLLLPAAPKMPEVVPWPRYDAQHHLGLGLGSSSGIGSGRRSRLHSALVAAARPPKTAACCRVAAADDRKRNLFWSKPQLDRDQDQGVSWHRKFEHLHHRGDDDRDLEDGFGLDCNIDWCDKFEEQLYGFIIITVRKIEWENE